MEKDVVKTDRSWLQGLTGKLDCGCIAGAPELIGTYPYRDCHRVVFIIMIRISRFKSGEIFSHSYIKQGCDAVLYRSKTEQLSQKMFLNFNIMWCIQTSISLQLSFKQQFFFLMLCFLNIRKVPINLQVGLFENSMDPISYQCTREC